MKREEHTVKYAVITGASGGIGQAISERLWQEGWSLLLIARHGQSLAALRQRLCSQSPDQGRQLAWLALDITQPAAAAELTQMADEFVRRGWLKQDGEVWTGSAEYAHGALQVNGQPFSLAQLLMGGGEPQADAAEEDDSTVDGVAGPGPQSSAAR